VRAKQAKQSGLAGLLANSKGSKPISNALPAQEWCFSDKERVPAAELLVCRLWEYARESAFICDASQLMRSIREATSFASTLSPHQRDLLERLNQICAAPDMDPDRYFRSPPFPMPWQTLDPALRAEWSKAWVSRPYSNWTGEPFYAIDSRLSWARFQGPDSNGDGTVPSSVRQVSADGVETMLVQIEWEKFTNKDIIAAFSSWLEANEPPGVARPPKSKQGHDPHDLRASLERLGIMRLIHRHSFDEMAKVVQAALPPKLADREKFSVKAEAAKERLKAANTFKSLFPLGDDEPKSWEPGPGWRR
jgi:hypothetical protein